MKWMRFRLHDQAAIKKDKLLDGLQGGVNAHRPHCIDCHQAVNQGQMGTLRKIIEKSWNFFWVLMSKINKKII